MLSNTTAMTTPLRLSDFERHHALSLHKELRSPGIRELVITLALTLFMAPFSFVTFMVIPMMGQVTVGLSFLLTVWYLVSRKSLLAFLTVLGGSILFGMVLFATIQVIKNNLEVPLFFFTATGIPVSAMYCIFIGTRIWTIRGGLD